MDSDKDKLIANLQLEIIKLNNEILELKELLRIAKKEIEILESGSSPINKSLISHIESQLSINSYHDFMAKPRDLIARHSNSTKTPRNEYIKLNLNGTSHSCIASPTLHEANPKKGTIACIKSKITIMSFPLTIETQDLKNSLPSKEILNDKVSDFGKSSIILEDTDPLKMKKLNDILVMLDTPTIVSNQSNLPNNMASLVDTNNEKLFSESLTQETNLLRRSTTVIFSKSPKRKVNPLSTISECKSVNTHLFEKFLIVGIDKDDLIPLEKNRQQSGLMTPRYLYAFPKKRDQIDDEDKIILDFFFPHGIKVTCESLDSSKKLDDIILWSPLPTIHKDCFIFMVKSHMSFDSSIKVDPLLDESNPLRIKYCICIKRKEYVISNNKKMVWTIEKVYCFITFYPIINLFFELLSQINDYIKTKRVLKISEFNENSKNYEDLDSKFANTILIKAIENGLNYYYYEFPPPNLDQLLNIQLFRKNFDDADPVIYQIPNKKLAYTMESIWALPYVFSYLSLSDILFLFTAALMETRLVIASEDTLLLTGTLFTLLNLLKPFEYTGQLIFILPKGLLNFIEAPGFYLYGINNTKKYLFSTRIIDTFDTEGCLFVCLDEREIYGKKKLLTELSFPLFQDLQANLEPHYFKINRQTKSTLNQISKTTNLNQTLNDNTIYIKEGQFPDDKKLVEPCLQILEIFKKFMTDRIIAYLPSEAFYIDTDTKELNLKLIIDHIVNLNPYQDDKKLIMKLVKNQTFMYYVQQHYDKLEKNNNT